MNTPELRLKDLRIGNFVNDAILEGEVLRITGIAERGNDNGILTYTRLLSTQPDFSYADKQEQYENSLSGVKPIILDEDWMIIRFGFKKRSITTKENTGIELNSYFLGTCEFTMHTNDWNLCCEFSLKVRSFKYVHELQNLYHALTGLELQIID